MDADRPAHPERTVRTAPTQRIPAAPTQQLPRADAERTQQLPASHTETIPESHPERPTRAMRQVRRRAEAGPWPAIPMLPVIRPEDAEPLSEVDRVREQRGVRALRDYLDHRTEDGEASAWTNRDNLPDTLYPPQG